MKADMPKIRLRVEHAVIEKDGPLAKPAHLRLTEPEHDSRERGAGARRGAAPVFSISSTERAGLQRQMWCDRISFRQMAEALHAWLRSEPQVGVVAVDYSGGYRVGILTNRLTRDTMRALHRSFERVRPRFGGYQLAVYVFGNKERDADILTDDTSYIIRRSK